MREGVGNEGRSEDEGRSERDEERSLLRDEERSERDEGRSMRDEESSF